MLFTVFKNPEKLVVASFVFVNFGSNTSSDANSRLEISSYSPFKSLRIASTVCSIKIKIISIASYSNASTLTAIWKIHSASPYLLSRIDLSVNKKNKLS